MTDNTNEHRTPRRAAFATRIGAIATTAGAAVGLGNVWRFPYEAGTHGGGAFMMCYILFIIVLGLPVICAEFIIGSTARCNQYSAYTRLKPHTRWRLTGYIGLTASLMILSFYSVVAGWTMEYCIRSATGGLQLSSPEQYGETFAAFTSGNWRPLFWTISFLVVNNYILLRGVAKGIERISNVLMPLLFVLIVIFCINSLTMPQAGEALKFLFKPDFSALTPQVLMGALGQAFFSLSIGLGCMITYASYFKRDTRIGRTAFTTASLDTLVAILSGVIIFPAVFSYGMSPAQGPTLVFEVLPSIFHRLPLGMVWSTLFFFLLFLASVTSTISMSEISISYMVEEKHLSRRTATWISTGIAMCFGTLCCLSFGCLSDVRLLGMTIFDIFNSVSSDLLLPIGGICISLFAGWSLPRKALTDALTSHGTHRCRYAPLLIAGIRYVAPLGISLILLNTLGLL